MNDIDVLILEDSEKDFVDIHETNINVFNSQERSFKFSYKENRAKTIHEARTLLSSNKNFSAAILDLNLSENNLIDEKGNEIVKEIYQKYRIPIFIYSKNLSLLDEELVPEVNVFLKRYSKADKSFFEILEEIEDLVLTGFIDILGKRGLIEEALNKIFWNHFSENIEFWKSLKKEKKEKEKILVRYISEHLKEHLELSDEKSNFEHYLPEEVYIFPAIKSFIFTGSIVRKKEVHEFYLVLNPACDFANKKADFVLISKIDPSSSLLSGIIKKYKKASDLLEDKEVKIRISVNLEKLLSNNCSPQYYYLPKSSNFEGGLIDFQRLNSFRKKQFENEFDVIGSITSSFMKDITAKFSFYYSRQGSPDFEIQKLIDKLTTEN
jgi:hypothetical protein